MRRSCTPFMVRSRVVKVALCRCFADLRRALGTLFASLTATSFRRIAMGERAALFWIALTMSAGAASAGGAPVAKSIDVSQPGLEQQIAAVRAQLQPGGRYQFVLDRDRLRLDQALTEIDRILDRRVSVADLMDGDKVALFHAQDVANAILLQNDSEHLACEDGSPDALQVRCLWPDLNRTGSIKRRESVDGRTRKLSASASG
jgi:hypothetical protein